MRRLTPAKKVELVHEATDRVPFEAIPLMEKIIVFPCVPDETGGLDVVDGSTENLPDLGVVMNVGYGAMAHIYDQLFHLESEINDAKGRDKTNLQARWKMIIDYQLIEVGDILALNKFSGMTIPGALLLAYEPADLMCKIRGLKVRLKRTDERYDEAWGNIASVTPAVAGSALVLP